MLVWLLILFGVVIVLLIIACRNLLIKNQQLEKYIQDFSKVEDDAEKFYRVIMGLLVETYSELNKVDKRGSFSSDDEVGFAFKVIYNSIESCKKAIENLRTDTSE